MPPSFCHSSVSTSYCRVVLYQQGLSLPAGWSVIGIHRPRKCKLLFTSISSTVHYFQCPPPPISIVRLDQASRYTSHRPWPPLSHPGASRVDEGISENQVLLTFLCLLTIRTYPGVIRLLTCHGVHTQGSTSAQEPLRPAQAWVETFKP